MGIEGTPEASQQIQPQPTPVPTQTPTVPPEVQNIFTNQDGQEAESMSVEDFANSSASIFNIDSNDKEAMDSYMGYLQEVAGLDGDKDTISIADLTSSYSAQDAQKYADTKEFVSGYNAADGKDSTIDMDDYFGGDKQAMTEALANEVADIYGFSEIEKGSDEYQKLISDACKDIVSLNADAFKSLNIGEPDENGVYSKEQVGEILAAMVKIGNDGKANNDILSVHEHEDSAKLGDNNEVNFREYYQESRAAKVHGNQEKSRESFAEILSDGKDIKNEDGTYTDEFKSYMKDLGKEIMNPDNHEYDKVRQYFGNVDFNNLDNDAAVNAALDGFINLSFQGHTAEQKISIPRFSEYGKQQETQEGEQASFTNGLEYLQQRTDEINAQKEADTTGVQEESAEAEKSQAQKDYDAAFKTYQDALSSSAGLPQAYLDELKGKAEQAAIAVTDETKAAYEANKNSSDNLAYDKAAENFEQAIKQEIALKGNPVSDSMNSDGNREVVYSDGTVVLYDAEGKIIPDKFSRIDAPDSSAEKIETPEEQAPDAQPPVFLPSEEDTQAEQTELMQQTFVLNSQSGDLEATKQQMLEYFDTLGTADAIYDKFKDTFGIGITKEDVEQYYNMEQSKLEVLTSVSQNGGEITLNEDNIETIKSLSQYTMQNFKTADEIAQYATDTLGVSDDNIIASFKEVLSNDFEIMSMIPQGEFDNFIQISKNDEGKYVINSEIPALNGKSLDEFIQDSSVLEKLTNSLVENSTTIQQGNQLSFDKVYQTVTGVNYNPDLIQNVMNTQSTYANLIQTQQNSIAMEQTLAQFSSPNEALEYFSEVAKGISQQTGEQVSSEDLFNQFYQTMFEQFPDKFQDQDNNGLTCKGIEVKDGYLWQELSAPEGYDEDSMDMLAQSDFLYKEIDEEGNAKYYKVVSLEDEHKVLSNISGQDAEYDQYFFANKKDDPTYSNHPLAMFFKANDSVRDNGLCLELNKLDYNMQNGENAFENTLEGYPKMYQEAFGNNALADKLGAYEKDMDSYASKIAMATALTLTAASMVPGVNVAEGVFIAAGFIDNGIDLVNLSSNNKDGEFGQWLKNTAIEAGVYALSSAIAKGIKESATGAKAAVDNSDDAATILTDNADDALKSTNMLPPAAESSANGVAMLPEATETATANVAGSAAKGAADAAESAATNAAGAAASTAAKESIEILGIDFNALAAECEKMAGASEAMNKLREMAELFENANITEVADFLNNPTSGSLRKMFAALTNISHPDLVGAQATNAQQAWNLLYGLLKKAV